MQEYNFHLWSRSKALIDEIKSAEIPRKSIINIFAAEEFEIDPLWSSGIYKDFFDDMNYRLNIVFGSSDLEFYNQTYESFSRHTIHYWPTFFINRTVSRLELTNQSSNMVFKKLFLSMNNAPRYHRCMFMDNIHKEKLNKHAYISWHKPKSILHYKWKYWRPKKLLLTDEKVKDINRHQWNLPQKFFETFMNVVTESSAEVNFLTEKTAIPLYTKKPFLVVGAKGYHSYLKRLGFKLYDVFDYSFDDADRLEDRIAGVIGNLNKLKDCNYDELYNECLPALEYNFNLIKSIALDENKIPNIVKTTEFSKNLYKPELLIAGTNVQ